MGFNFNFSIGFNPKEEKKQNDTFEKTTVTTENDAPPSFDKETQIINRVLEEQSHKFAATSSAPITAGRTSQPEETSLLPNTFGAINSDFPFHLLKILEDLVCYNNHVSQAVENVVSLANTDVETFFSDNVSSREQRKMKDHLKLVRNNWYELSEGENSLLNDLFTQVATFGALSAERVPMDDLSGIKKVVKVPPATIRFAHDKDKDIYLPLQKVALANLQGSTRFPGHIELNTRTYSYIAYRRVGSVPYAIPPFFSALEGLILERDMMKGFKNMIKKMGVLGFLSVLTQLPSKRPGEGDETYYNRLTRHLETLRPQVEKGYANGVAVGYKGHHEFNVEGNNMNVQGADGLFKIAKSYVFSGVKQDPNMMGENYSTTETFGRVILAKTTKQMENYQKIVAHFMAQVEYDELILNNFRPGFVEKVFQKAMIGDQKREEETEALKLKNVATRFFLGYTNQQTAANEAGYEKPFAPMPLAIPQGFQMLGVPGEESKGPENATPDKDNTTPKQEATENERPSLRGLGGLLLSNHASAPEFNYFVPEIDQDQTVYKKINFAPRMDITGVEFDNVSFPDNYLSNQARGYTKKVNSKFQKAIDAALPSIKEGIKRLPENTSRETLQQTVLFYLLKDWKPNFRQQINPVISENVENVYSHFRKDKSVFEDAKGFSLGRTHLKERGINFTQSQTILSEDRRSGKIRLFDIPDPTFDLLDYRAIEYSEQSDNFYLGKFITDEDTQRRLKAFIDEKYLGEGNPIGATNKVMNAFIEEFADQVGLEAWKISRIIDTSVNKIRNFANVNYIKQAGLAQFEVVEVMDRLTCAYCQHMNGKVFSVEKSVEKIDKAINGGAEEVKKFTPFATTVKIDEFKNLTAEDLQARGFDAPSYHPKCRGRVVAVI